MSTMSSGSAATAPRTRSRSSRIVEEATRRARLSVVPRRRVRAPRVPFVTLVSLILVSGVVGLLCFNTQMQQASFTTSTLEERAENLSARRQTLEMELEDRRSPNRVAADAQKAGLVIPTSAAQLSLATGAVTGVATPADGSATPQLEGRAPLKPAELSPPPNTTYVQAPADQAAVADAAASAALAAQAAQAAADQAAATAKAKKNKQSR